MERAVVEMADREVEEEAPPPEESDRAEKRRAHRVAGSQLAPTGRPSPLLESRERLFNRELSWLDFNARVLELAENPHSPLLERVKFSSIFSSNLDEFFMVRVGGLLEQESSNVSVRSPDGRTPREAIDEIRARATELTRRQSDLWVDTLQPALAENSIVVGTIEDMTRSELDDLTKRFELEIFPVLTPLAVGPGHPFPYISGLSLSLALFVRDPTTDEERFARVKVPESLPRFIAVGERGLILTLEDIIGKFLPYLFPEMEIVERAVFRVTRDADFEVSDDAADLLEAVEMEVRRRRFGEAVRLEISRDASRRMIERLKAGLRIDEDQIYPTRGPLDLAELSEIAALNRPELKQEPWVPVTQPRLVNGGSRDLFAEIRRGDILVHRPYESFASSFEAFVHAAVADPAVIGLKAIIYRTSDDSELVPALVELAEDGKQSVCLVELKARFDERGNIVRSREMEKAGVHVVYGFSHRKIHAKATLIVRRESGGLRRYVHVGTGNYNALTARLYEDFDLFTADEEIAADVADLFNHLTGFGKPQRYRKLLVSPFTVRSGLIDRIRQVGHEAAAGRPAGIVFKVNAITDPVIIEELYKASTQGARIELIVRGICSLRPGVPGLSENIRVRSILGRFLEHSRVYRFRTEQESVHLLGSADLMQRNLDDRIEILAPIEDSHVKARIDEVLETLLKDTAQSWLLGSDGTWCHMTPDPGARGRGGHTVFMETAADRTDPHSR